MKNYVFDVEIEQDTDGRWGAEIPLLPGCNAWGYTREEALESLQEVAQAFVETILEDGESFPEEASVEHQFTAVSAESIPHKVTVTL